MTNAFTLEDLNKALAEKYQPWVFQAGREKFSLKQVLSLPKEQRQEVKAMLEKLQDTEGLDEDTVLAILKAVLEHVVEGGKTDKLLAVLDYDLAKISILFEKWTESTQVGEA